MLLVGDLKLLISSIEQCSICNRTFQAFTVVRFLLLIPPSDFFSLISDKKLISDFLCILLSRIKTPVRQAGKPINLTFVYRHIFYDVYVSCWQAGQPITKWTNFIKIWGKYGFY